MGIIECKWEWWGNAHGTISTCIGIRKGKNYFPSLGKFREFFLKQKIFKKKSAKFSRRELAHMKQSLQDEMHTLVTQTLYIRFEALRNAIQEKDRSAQHKMQQLKNEVDNETKTALEQKQLWGT